MISRNFSLLMLGVLFCTLGIMGCEEDVPKPIPFFDRNSGVYFTQEGAFGSGTGALGFYNYKTDSVTLDAYSDVNLEPVGTILQSAMINAKEFFLVVNGSGRITEVKIEGPQKIRSIAGIPSPNFMVKSADNEAIVTDLFGPYLYKLDLRTGLITDSLNVGGGTGEAFIGTRNIFVTKTSDYLAEPSKYVLAIDLSSFEIVDTVEVGFNPIALVDDVNGNIWVHCNGNNFENRKGGLYKFDPKDVRLDSVLEVLALPFPELTTTPSRIATNVTKTRVYFLNNDVYSIGYRETTLPAAPDISANGRNFYGLAIRPDNEDIYLSTENFIGESKVYIYGVDKAEKVTFDCLVGLNHFYF